MKVTALYIVCLLLASCGFWGESEDSAVDVGREPDGAQQGDAGDGAPPSGAVDDLPGVSEATTSGDFPCGCSSERIVSVASDGTICYFLTRMGCGGHAECNDGIYCNTEERCGRLSGGETACYVLCCSCSPCTDTPDATCRPGVCSEEQRACAYPLKDSDGDGYSDRACEEGGSDCNDDDPSTYPAAPEVCDRVDNDCDDTADEDAWSAAGQPVALTDGEEGIQDVDAAPLGGDWIVAWSRGAGAGLRIGVYGADASSPPVPESTPLVGTEGAGEVEVIASAGEIVLAWIEADRSVKGRKLAYSGEFQELASAVIFDGPLPDSTVKDLELAGEPDGGSAAMFFRNQDPGNYEIYAVRFAVSSFGEADVAAPVRLTHAIGFSGYPSAAAVEGFYAVAWEDDRDGNKEVYFNTVDLMTMLPGDEKRITFAPGDSRYPSVAGLPAGFVVSWIDEGVGSYNVMAAQLDAGGDPVGFPVAMTGAQGAAAYASIASDPRDPGFAGQALIVYAAAGIEDRELYFTAVGAQSLEIKPGSRIHSTRFAIEKPVLSGSGDSRALTWIERSYSASDLYFLALGCVPPG